MVPPRAASISLADSFERTVGEEGNDERSGAHADRAHRLERRTCMVDLSNGELLPAYGGKLGESSLRARKPFARIATPSRR